MNIGAVVFSGLCVIAVVMGIFFMVGITHNAPAIKDTYGNKMSDTGNSSQIANASAAMSEHGDSGIVWIILIVAAIIVCVCIAGAYALSRIIT